MPRLFQSSVFHFLYHQACTPSLRILDCFFIFQGLQLDFKEAYLAFHRSPEVDLEDDACTVWFSYVGSSGDAVHVPAR